MTPSAAGPSPMVAKYKGEYGRGHLVAEVRKKRRQDDADHRAVDLPPFSVAPCYFQCFLVHVRQAPAGASISRLSQNTRTDEGWI